MPCPTPLFLDGYCKCPMKCECCWGFNQEMVCLRKSSYITWTGWLIDVTGKKLLNLNPEKKKGNWVTNIPDILMMIIPLSLILATLVASPSARHELLIQARNCDPKLRPTSAMPKKTCNQLVLCYLSLDWRNTRALPTPLWPLKTDTKILQHQHQHHPSPLSEKSPPSLYANHQLQTCQKTVNLWWASEGTLVKQCNKFGGETYMWVVLQKLQIAKLTGTSMRGGQIGG